MGQRYIKEEKRSNKEKESCNARSHTRWVEKNKKNQWHEWYILLIILWENKHKACTNEYYINAIIQFPEIFFFFFVLYKERIDIENLCVINSPPDYLYHQHMNCYLYFPLMFSHSFSDEPSFNSINYICISFFCAASSHSLCLTFFYFFFSKKVEKNFAKNFLIILHFITQI